MPAISSRLDSARLPAVPGPPPKILELLEVRVVSELATAFATLPLLRHAPRGDGHPVLVFPGLLASDASTRLMRAYLTERGHDVHGWGLGRNLGLVSDLETRMRDRVQDLHARS